MIKVIIEIWYEQQISQCLSFLANKQKPHQYNGMLLVKLTGAVTFLESISPTFYERDFDNFLAPIKSLTFTLSTK
jgi:hypothetical protein